MSREKRHFLHLQPKDWSFENEEADNLFALRRLNLENA